MDGWMGLGWDLSVGLLYDKNDIRDVGSTAHLVLVLLVHLVHWYPLVSGTLVPTGT